MTASFEYREFTELARDLGKVGSPELRRNVERVVEHSAGSVKDRWNGKLYSEGHAKLTGRSISYDVGTAFDLGIGTSLQDQLDAGSGAAAIVAEIGPRKGNHRQAGVVVLLENGAPAQNLAPHGYGAASLAEEEADFEARLAFAEWAAAKEAGLA